MADSYRIPVYSGLLTAEHHSRIGDSAIWEFLWLINRVTKEVDGIGYVLNGIEVSCQQIADDFGTHRNTVLANLNNLAAEGYITLIRGRHGYRINVMKSKKFGVEKEAAQLSLPEPEDKGSGTPAPKLPKLVIDQYNHKFPGVLSGITMDQLAACVREFGVDATVGAIKRSTKHRVAYIRGILSNAREDGTLDELISGKQKGASSGGRSGRKSDDYESSLSYTDSQGVKRDRWGRPIG